MALNGTFDCSLPSQSSERPTSAPVVPDTAGLPCAPSLQNTEWPANARSISQPYFQSTSKTHPVTVEPNFQAEDSHSRADDASPEHSIHAIIGSTLEENQRQGFFGSSSAGTFMQSVKKMVEEKLGGPSSVSPASSRAHNGLPSLAPGQGPIHPNADYVLPSRRKADSLMSLYWQYVHTLYPYLDRLQVQDDYDKLWRCDGCIPDERSFLCLINAMFALSSQIDTTILLEERNRVAAVFYERARMSLDIVEMGSVRSVQAFLILGQYFQSTNEPHRCWIFVGLGIRTAQSLGLHLPETSECVSDLRTKQTLRKVWHGCVLMDRVVSMTYGRPLMVGTRSAMAVPLPQPMPDELLPSEFTGPQIFSSEQEPHPSAIDFYVSSLKLYDILHDVLSNFYHVHNEQNTRTFEGPYDRYFGRSQAYVSQPSVFELERALEKWEDELPSHLRLGTRQPPLGVGWDNMLYRQAKILHQRQVVGAIQWV